MLGRHGRLRQDLRVALRFLGRRPVATAVAVLTLGIAVAVSATAVALLDQALWRDARAGSGLVAVYNARPAAPQFQVLSWPDYEAVRDRLADAVALAAFVRIQSTAGGGDLPVRVTGELVSDNYFAVLGGRAERGRLLDASVPASSAVIAYEFWQRHFNGRADILGASLSLGRDVYTIVGVAAPGLRDPAYTPAFWVPASAARRIFRQDLLPRPDVPLFQTVGRLAPGITAEQVRGRVGSWPTAASKDGWALTALPGSQLRFWPAYREAVASFLRIFVALGLCILLIAAANLAGLLLARSVERGRELAVRQSLGASRGDLIRRVAAESALLTAGGLALGLLVIAWLTTLLPRVPLPVPAPLTLILDLRTASIALVLSLLAAGLFAGLSVLRGVAHDPYPGLAGRGAAALPALTARLLVAGQVAISTALLIVGGLLARSAWQVNAVDDGVAEANHIIGLVGLRDQDYDDRGVVVFYERLLQRLRERPDVEAAALGWHVPLTPVRVTGTYALGADAPLAARQNVISPGYFATLDVPLLEGRDFTAADRTDGEPVAIVNEQLARLAGGEAVGRQLRDTRSGRSHRVIGVVRDIKYNGITEPALPFVYFPLAQAVRPDMHAHVRTRGAAAPALIAAAVHDLDARVAVSDAMTFATVRHEAEAVPRTAARVAAAAAALAVFLAVVGLYGVLTTTVEQRRRELAIRAALGATPAAIVTRTMAEGAVLTVAGLAIGWLAGLGSGRLVADLLFGISRHDAAVFAAAPIVVCTVSALAWIAPARRAARIDPASVLRGD